jgi:hypothetical protein
MMPKHGAKAKDSAKPVPLDDAGEIQVVPIDTVIDDGAHDLEADAQGFGARSYRNGDASRSSRTRWREPDIVA